ncbi:hypothetical protein ARMGADRAFT_535066 [Armillaria gallica]|uniref:Uncharacterized protein n=1 Tax=Armillaria gallica TaxID=47427 RepID=A0A2H3CX12_ARMGA|nr:hypothetical protein ARMGADRAFT_535066 [Armillaria gallica]
MNYYQHHLANFVLALWTLLRKATRAIRANLATFSLRRRSCFQDGNWKFSIIVRELVRASPYSNGHRSGLLRETSCSRGEWRASFRIILGRIFGDQSIDDALKGVDKNPHTAVSKGLIFETLEELAGQKKSTCPYGSRSHR